MEVTLAHDAGGDERPAVLAVAGSPRRNGNTDLLLRQVVRGAESAGAEVKTVFLRDLCIAPCRHCDGCVRKKGRCVVDDDMQWVHTELRRADRIAIASPIFFMGLTAQTKAMIDRCQALWVMKHVLNLPVATSRGGERRGLFVSVGGTRGENLFRPAMATIKIFFQTLEFSYGEELFFRGIDGKGEIRQHPTALADAFAAGQRLAQG